MTNSGGAWTPGGSEGGQGEGQNQNQQQQQQGGWTPPPTEGWQPGQWQSSWERPRTGPGVILGPLTLADILDGSFKLLRANWRSIGTAVLVYSLPISLLSMVLEVAFMGDRSTSGAAGIFVTYDDPGDGRVLAAAIGVFALQILYNLFAYPLLSAVIVRVASASYLGRQVQLGQAFNGVLPLWPRLIGAFLLAGIPSVLGLAFCIFPGVVLWTLFSLIVPIIAVEEQGPIDALQRSWKLVSKRFWPYLGTLILAAVVARFVGGIISLIPTLIGVIFSAIGLTPLYWAFAAIGQVASNMVILPFLGLVTLLIYFDARIRNEGFDVQVMAAELDTPRQP